MKTLGLIVGSIREGSFNRVIANTMIDLDSGVELEMIEIKDLPFFNEDVEANGDPAEVAAFKQQIEQVDGLIILTPEYNGGMPGVLKNALDWASRPANDSVFLHKRVGIIGATPGMMGTIVAQLHARHTLEAMRASVVPHEALHISRVHASYANERTTRIRSVTSIVT